MNTDTKHQIETALRAFSGADLRAAAIGLLNSLGYADLSDFFFVWLKRALPGHPLLHNPF